MIRNFEKLTLKENWLFSKWMNGKNDNLTFIMNIDGKKDVGKVFYK